MKNINNTKNKNTYEKSLASLVIKQIKIKIIFLLSKSVCRIKTLERTLIHIQQAGALVLTGTERWVGVHTIDMRYIQKGLILFHDK